APTSTTPSAWLRILALSGLRFSWGKRCRRSTLKAFACPAGGAWRWPTTLWRSAWIDLTVPDGRNRPGWSWARKNGRCSIRSSFCLKFSGSVSIVVVRLVFVLAEPPNRLNIARPSNPSVEGTYRRRSIAIARISGTVETCREPTRRDLIGSAVRPVPSVAFGRDRPGSYQIGSSLASQVPRDAATEPTPRRLGWTSPAARRRMPSRTGLARRDPQIWDVPVTPAHE